MEGSTVDVTVTSAAGTSLAWPGVERTRPSRTRARGPVLSTQRLILGRLREVAAGREWRAAVGLGQRLYPAEVQ